MVICAIAGISSRSVRLRSPAAPGIPVTTTDLGTRV